MSLQETWIALIPHEIMNLLDQINQRGTTVIVVTHSQEMVAEMNKRVITMDRGEVVRDEGGSGI